MNLARTEESEWLTALDGLPAWAVPPRRLVLVTPHPDDEILGAGGLLTAQARRDLPITVVAVTDGEAAYPDAPDLAEIRRREQESALAAAGVTSPNIERLGLPDGRVAAFEVELFSRLAPLLDENTLLLAPWSQDPHPDHEACGRAANQAAAATGALHVSYFFWSWHHCRPDQILALELCRFDLDPEIERIKAAALSEYRSQLMWESGQPILPEGLLAPARRPFETFAIHDTQS